MDKFSLFRKVHKSIEVHPIQLLKRERLTRFVTKHKGHKVSWANNRIRNSRRSYTSGSGCSCEAQTI